MAEKNDEKFHWIIMFKKDGKLYPYLNRTVPFMTQVIQRYYDEHADYPFRMWVIVEDEVQKVMIT